MIYHSSGKRMKQNKKGITVSFSKDLISEIDRKRGLIPRSAFVESELRKQLEST